eukprot:TRINITY_DN11935_c0_g1_i1.p1 TRINITY_DN11935_c0_g1~~TRINITY_DN11935_c0_g1_i1.p1  ORF type:complete len:195 (-),score=39.51 TRINITY_DN11935_c0_g1_i1:92-676(-)
MAEDSNEVDVKCVVVGDGTVGKTSLLISFTENKFPVEHVPTIFDNFTKEITVDGKKINLTLIDTAGQEEYSRLRSLSYPETDVFLLCFSLISQTAFDNVKSKWHPEVQHYCPNGKYIIVGTKADLQQKDTENSDSWPKDKDAENFLKSINGYKYLRCSALTQLGVANVFEEAVRAVINPSLSHETKKKGGCTVL